MRTRYDLDYACPKCGAQAVKVTAEGSREQRVVVPHGVGCPVAAYVAKLRAQAVKR
jgi:hypothetical protein